MKISIFITVFCISLGLVGTSSYGSEVYWLGDFNLDGVVTIDDGIHLQEFLFNKAPPPIFPHAADANADGRLTQDDVFYIASVATGVIDRPAGVVLRLPPPDALELESIEMTATVGEESWIASLDGPFMSFVWLPDWSQGDFAGGSVSVDSGDGAIFLYVFGGFGPLTDPGPLYEAAMCVVVVINGGAESIISNLELENGGIIIDIDLDIGYVVCQVSVCLDCGVGSVFVSAPGDPMD